MVIRPRRTSSNLPLSKVRISSGDLKRFRTVSSIGGMLPRGFKILQRPGLFYRGWRSGAAEFDSSAARPSGQNGCRDFRLCCQLRGNERWGEGAADAGAHQVRQGADVRGDYQQLRGDHWGWWVQHENEEGG